MLMGRCILLKYKMWFLSCQRPKILGTVFKKCTDFGILVRVLIECVGICIRRVGEVVTQGSAKPPCAGPNPARASNVWVVQNLNRK
jgi:hypothetical protein